jgi:hypothetical protein
MPESYLLPDGRLYINGELLEPPAPPGYGITANPSPTIPVASGVLADLISEAKRSGIRYNALRLVQAVLTGTDFLPRLPRDQQSHGLIDAAAAFEQLRRMARADDPDTSQLTSFKITRGMQTQATQVYGYVADLPHAGASTMAGDLWITRLGGYPGGRRFRFGIRNNDGTYKLVTRSAALVQGQPARVKFQIRARAGMHQSFLQLRDDRTGTVMQEVPLSIRVPELPTNVAPGVEEYRARIEPRRADIRYIRLPDGVQAARYTMRIPGDGGSALSAAYIFPGFLRYADRNVPSTAAAADSPHHIGPIQQFESLVRVDSVKTEPVYWGNRSLPEYETPYDAPAPDVPIEGVLTVSQYAIELKKVDGGSIRLTNKLAAVDGGVEFYGSQTLSKQLAGVGAHDEVGDVETMPADVAQWRVMIGANTVAATHADAFLLNCTELSGCRVAAAATLEGNDGALSVDSPAPGSWRIVIRRGGPAAYPSKYELKEELLIADGAGSVVENRRYASGETAVLAVPENARYVAFRIAGTPGIKAQEKGVRIEITPLDTTRP